MRKWFGNKNEELASDVRKAAISPPVTPTSGTELLKPSIDELILRNRKLEDRARRATDSRDELARKLTNLPSEVAIDRLVEVDARRRNLSDEAFEQLVENLRGNALIHPIVVRRLAGERFEIISGHHRVDAFRRLGRSVIPAVVMNVREHQSHSAAFHANLFQDGLCDFEKFRGYQRERDRHDPPLSQSALAQIVGVRRQIVSRLLAFESLPAEALELLEANPHVIGWNCVAALNKCVKKDSSERVIEAIRRLVSGATDQNGAVAYAARPREMVKSLRPAPTKIRAGRVTFCSYVGSGRTMRIDFKDEALRAEAEGAIQRLLNELAAEAR